MGGASVAQPAGAAGGIAELEARARLLPRTFFPRGPSGPNHNNKPACTSVWLGTQLCVRASGAAAAATQHPMLFSMGLSFDAAQVSTDCRILARTLHTHTIIFSHSIHATYTYHHLFTFHPRTVTLMPLAK